MPQANPMPKVSALLKCNAGIGTQLPLTSLCALIPQSPKAKFQVLPTKAIPSFLISPIQGLDRTAFTTPISSNRLLLSLQDRVQLLPLP